MIQWVDPDQLGLIGLAAGCPPASNIMEIKIAGRAPLGPESSPAIAAGDRLSGG